MVLLCLAKCLLIKIGSESISMPCQSWKTWQGDLIIVNSENIVVVLIFELEKENHDAVHPAWSPRFRCLCGPLAGDGRELGRSLLCVQANWMLHDLTMNSPPC